MLFGRKTYEQFAALWPERTIEGDALAEKINQGQKIVFSNSIARAPWGKWNDASVQRGDPVPLINSLKSTEGKNLILWGSLSLAQTLMRNNLVDEYHILICPTINGGGKKLFANEMPGTPLTLMQSERYTNGVVSLQYQIKI